MDAADEAEEALPAEAPLAMTQPADEPEEAPPATQPAATQPVPEPAAEPTPKPAVPKAAAPPLLKRKPMLVGAGRGLELPLRPAGRPLLHGIALTKNCLIPPS